MAVSLITEKRDCEPKNSMAIHVAVDGKMFRNIWALKDVEMTENVMNALKSAVDAGIQLAHSEVSLALSSKKLHMER